MDRTECVVLGELPNPEAARPGPSGPFFAPPSGAGPYRLRGRGMLYWSSRANNVLREIPSSFAARV